jgi:hypothetical protein
LDLRRYRSWRDEYIAHPRLEGGIPERAREEVRSRNLRPRGSSPKKLPAERLPQTLLPQTLLPQGCRRSGSARHCRPRVTGSPAPGSTSAAPPQGRRRNFAIRPALDAHGLELWRTDRQVLAGIVVNAIRQRIRHCYFAIADTTEDRPNVKYELGMAHAEDKPVILLRRAHQDGTHNKAPFDLQTGSIISYSDDINALRERLLGAIAVIRAQTTSLDDIRRGTTDPASDRDRELGGSAGHHERPSNVARR